MRILYIHYSLGAGGAERFLVDLANRVANDYGCEVTILTILDSRNHAYLHFKKDLSNKVNFINLRQRRALSLSSILGVYKFIKNQQPDIVHAHCSFWLLLLPSIIYKKIRFLLTIHSTAQRCAPGTLNHIISRWLYKKHVQPITISNKCHQSYVDYYHINNDIIIENGRESVQLSDRYSDVKRFIESLKKRMDTPIFVHVARHHPVKNHNRLFKTFKRLCEEHIDFQLIVIGDKYDSYQTEFKHHPYIHLIGKQDNVGDYLSCSDYFVLTSDNEGLPISLLEAMSVGVIPICTPAGGITDVIIDGVNGYMSETISDEAFYLAVKNAISEKHKLRKSDIKKVFNTYYSMKICAFKYFELYKKVSNDDKK